MREVRGKEKGKRRGKDRGNVGGVNGVESEIEEVRKLRMRQERLIKKGEKLGETRK